jgi:DNA polymerase III subunit delta
VAIVAEAQLAQTLKRRGRELAGMLIHGENEPAVADVAKDVQGWFAKGAVEGVNVLRVDRQHLRGSPGWLSDEYRAASLLGERQVIVVSGCDDTVAAEVANMLSVGVSGNFVILLAAALQKKSQLRQLCEDHAGLLCLPIYDEEGKAARARVTSALATEGLEWGEGAEELFFMQVGEDRTAALREVEKLAIYALGERAITLEAVEALCGEQASYSPDELIDAALAGRSSEVERMLSSEWGEPGNAGGLLAQLQFHLQRLQALRLDMAKGAALDAAMSRARPPVFFKRKAAVASQLRTFDLPALEDMVIEVSRAVFTVRQHAALSPAALGRLLMKLPAMRRST